MLLINWRVREACVFHFRSLDIVIPSKWSSVTHLMDVPVEMTFKAVADGTAFLTKGDKTLPRICEH